METNVDVTLSVPEISCEHCVKTINGALGALPGVENVNTDIATKSVQFRYNPDQTPMTKIEATLDEAGYSVAHA